MKREQLSVYDDHGDDSFAYFVVFAFSWLPYLALAWAFMKLTDEGHARDFRLALGVLLALRLFFSTIEAVGGFFLWRLYGRSSSSARRSLYCARTTFRRANLASKFSPISIESSARRTVRHCCGIGRRSWSWTP